MMNITVAYNQDKIKEIVGLLLHKKGNTTITITRNGQGINVIEGDPRRGAWSLEEQVLCLGEAWYNSQRGALYKSIIDSIEKPLIEDILRRTEGNQLKAARILGINRNTLRAKIKKLGIASERFKQK